MSSAIGIAAGCVLVAGILASAAAPPRRPPPRPAPSGASRPAARSAELDQLAREYDALEAKRASFAAAKLARRGLALAIEATGPESSVTDVWQNRLADALVMIGDWAGAVAIRKQQLAVAEKRHGPDSGAALSALVPLELAYPTSQFDEREAVMRRELALTQKLHGEHSIEAANEMTSYANLLRDRGEYAAAVPLLERSLQIHEAAAKAERDLEPQIRSLAVACWWAGQRPRAIALFDRLLAITGALTGKPGVSIKDRAGVLSWVVNAYREGGRDDLARPLAGKELELFEAELARLQREQPDSDELMNQMGYLATLYYQNGELAKSAAMTEQAYALAVKRNDTTMRGSGLADLRRSQGKPREALAVLERAQADAQRTMPHIGAIFSPQIADLLTELGEFARAERVRAEYRASVEKTYGRHSTIYGITEESDALLYAAMGKPELAERALADGFEISERELAHALQTGTETDHGMSLASVRHEVDLVINLQRNHAPRNGPLARLGLTTVLRRKGRALDAIAGDLGAIRARMAPDDRRLLDELASARAQLARLTVAGPAATGDADFARQVADYEAQIQKLEVEVGRKSTAYRAASQPIALAAVQKAIPADAKLVELASFNAYDGKVRYAFGLPPPPRHYAAYVAGRAGDPVLIDLGPAQPIDEAIEQFRKAVSDPDSERARELGHALFTLTLAKLAPALGGATRVLIAPDGALAAVPFAALVDDGGDFLIKRFTFTYLTSGRDLLRLTHDTRPRSPGAIFADPTFDAAPGAAAAVRGKRSIDLARQVWQRLPGTAQEADEIARHLRGATVYRGPRATETALKALHGPRILHLATHGFFLADDQPLAPAQTSPSTIYGSPTSVGARENPLLRSGLVFAGANQLSSGDDDGILTALEAAGLDLAGTQLVVLSACETGVGKLTNGDGVYGLRRALVIAGAESLVMSLWEVDDAATRDLMTGFYARLAAGAPRSAALRDIQLALLAQPRYAHPFYWASFLPTGDSTALR